jgi:hypothetical protein
VRVLTRLLTATVVVVACAVVAAPSSPVALPSAAGVGSAGAGAAEPAEMAAPASGLPPLDPVTPTVETYPVSGVDPTARATLGKSAPADLAALSPAVPADAFVVVGATWKGRPPVGLELAVRTRTDDRWSAWTPMSSDAEHGPTPGSVEAAAARPGTDPFVAGDVDDVQLRATSRRGVAPAGLTLSVIDPGASVPAEGASRSTDAKAAAPAGTATKRPPIYSRADWGADERLRDCCVEYGEVHAGFVHHTVNANAYKKSEVPAILRGIYAYHTQSRGWRDIGYNFLIDKFGRIWEGRFGGLAKPVVGAHTLDYNESSFAASAIGNFETAKPSAAMLDAYARLYAWKLSLHGVRPGSRQNVAGTAFDAINGHRDAASTACPGIHLYRKIPQIIEKATAYQRAFAGRGLSRDLVGADLRPDLLTVNRTSGRLAIARGTGAPGFGAARTTTTELAGMDQVTVVGDLTGDGLDDVTARNDNGVTRLYRGTDDQAFAATSTRWRLWAGTDLYAAPGDLTGDGRPDVVARATATGALMLYAGRPDARFAAGVVARASFGAMDRLASAGDFDGDGFRDVLARSTAGKLRVFYGDGAGSFPRWAVLATDWSGKSLVSGGMDLTGDSRPDVVARSAGAKTTSVHANIGGARLSPKVASLSTPITSLNVARSGTSRAPELVVTRPNGRLDAIPVLRQNWFGPPRTRNLDLDGVGRVAVVGDWDASGTVDLMARDQAGRMWLYPGRASGGFDDRVGGWPGWSKRAQVTPVGDFDGDGRPDLMAKSRGAVYLYPGRGLDGFARPVLARSSLPKGSSMYGVGRWDGDGAPDVMVLKRNGRLLLYPGNGPGGLDDPVVLGRRYDDFNMVVGAGDVDGDKRADMVGRTVDGDLWLLPGAGGGKVGHRLYLASGWSAYRMG